MELIFIEKLFDIKDADADVIRGNVLLFHDYDTDEIIDGKIMPEIMIVAIYDDDIQKITASNKYDKETIKKELIEKYTIKKLLEI